MFVLPPLFLGTLSLNCLEIKRNQVVNVSKEPTVTMILCALKEEQDCEKLGQKRISHNTANDVGSGKVEIKKKTSIFRLSDGKCSILIHPIT